jgi:uncharacterized membrane protein
VYAFSLYFSEGRQDISEFITPYLKALLNYRGAFFMHFKKQTMSEKSYRSIVKSISWRTIGTIDTIIISFVITGKAGLALSIGGVEVFTKMGLYYVHERTWNRINFGKINKTGSDYQI